MSPCRPPIKAVAICFSALRGAVRWSPGWFAATIVSDAALALLPALQVLAVSWLTTAVAHNRGDVTQAAFATAAAVGASYLCSGLLGDVSQTQRSIQQSRLMCELRRVIAAMRPSQLADNETATKIQAARSAVDYTLNGLAANLVHVAAAVLTAASLLLVLWRIDPVAAVLVVASLFPMILNYQFMSRVRRKVVRQMNQNERVARYFTDQLVYQRSATELASLAASSRVAAWADAPTLANTRIVHRFGWQSMGADAAASVAVTGLAAAALLEMSRGSVGAGPPMAGILGVISGIAATRNTGAALGQILLAVPLMETYAEVVDGNPALQIAPLRAEAIDRIEACHLHLTYPGRNIPALNDVSISARRGQVIAIVGANGAGKTTLVSALLGILTPDSGTIRADSQDLAVLPEAERIARFGLLTQEFGRYELTVRQSLLLGTPSYEPSDDELWRALEQARAEAFVRALPDGLDSQLGQQWGGVGISGGQWQRLALARICLRNAPIWILDEPTSAVDAESEAAIFNQLAENKAGHITILITHRALTLRQADRIYVLDSGNLVQSGSYEQLATAPGRFRDMFAAELRPPSIPEQNPWN